MLSFKYREARGAMSDCRTCRYFSSNLHLPCAVHPELLADCPDHKQAEKPEWNERIIHYRLEDHAPVPCESFSVWAKWFEYSDSDRIVARTEVKGLLVSTVFLGIDHNFIGEGYPILFETMIFTEIESLNYQERYSTWQEAEEGHQKAIEYAASIIPSYNPR